MAISFVTKTMSLLVESLMVTFATGTTTIGSDHLLSPVACVTIRVESLLMSRGQSLLVRHDKPDLQDLLVKRDLLDLPAPHDQPDQPDQVRPALVGQTLPGANTSAAQRCDA